MQNWEYKELGDVCDFIAGYTPKTDDLSSNGKIPYFKVSDMNREGNELFMSVTELFVINPKRLIPQYSIVFPKNGGAVFTNKKRILAQESVIDLNSEAICSNGFVDTNYLYHFFQTIDLKDYSKGAALPTIDLILLKSVEIPLPPLEEQKRIVKILDEKFAMLETVKANAKTNLQNAKDLFQSQLTKAFSNTTWEKKRLQECTSIIGDGLHGTPKYDDEGEYYFINGSNLTTTDIIFTPETKRVNANEYQKYKVELNENTVFLSINGSTLGKRTAFYKGEPVILGKSACYINVKECLNKYYLKHYFSSNIFQEYAWKEKTGAAIPNLGLKAMRDMTIPLPPLSEQNRIVEQLDSLSEKVRSLEEIYTKQLANCDELKQAFLAKAFNGEL